VTTMENDPYLPPDPLERFLSLAREVAGHKHWHQGWTSLRYATVGLLTVPGPEHEVAERLFQAADELKRRAGWFSSLAHDIRFSLAAALLRRGGDGRRFNDVLEHTRALFRKARLPRGETREALATLILAEHASGGRPTQAQVERVAAVHAEMRRHHRFLTGTDDYPAAALLSTTGEEPAAMARRIERFYRGLVDLRFRRGNQLQTASHLLFFCPAPDDVALRRFRELYSAFQAEGLWMNEGDYDEVAILAFLDHDARRVARRVIDDRTRIRGLSPKPSKQEGFTLASSTAFLGLAPLTRELESVMDVAHLVQVQALVQAQQAAAAMAASSAATAAAASS